MENGQVYNNKDVIEVNLKDLCLSLFLHWKKILIIALVMALLASGYVSVKGLAAYYDRESAQAKSEEYQRLLNDYERNVAQLQKKIEDIETELMRQEKYRESSVMLLINPYEVHTEKISYFVDTNYEIAPSQYYQTPDYTPTIVNAYVTEIDGVDYDAVINSNAGTSLTSHNPVSGSILKLVNTVAKPDSGIIEITIYGDSDERISLMRDAINAVISEKQASFSSMIGAHNLEKLSDTKKVSVNKDFVALRDTFNTNFDTLSANLDATKRELSDLSEPTNNVPSRRSTAKRAVKYFIAGAVLGVILGCCLLGWYLLFAGKLVSQDELERKSGIPIIGTIAKDTPKGVNKWALKQLGTYTGESVDQMVAYLASNIVLLRGDKNKDILLCGDVCDEKFEFLREKLSEVLTDAEIKVAGDINKSSKALDSLASEADIICVEELQKSSYGDILNQIKIIQNAGKSVIGTVLLV